jgi:hypothetical protein
MKCPRCGYDDDPWAGGVAPFSNDWDDPDPPSPRRLSSREWEQWQETWRRMGEAMERTKTEMAIRTLTGADDEVSP